MSFAILIFLILLIFIILVGKLIFSFKKVSERGEITLTCHDSYMDGAGGLISPSRPLLGPDGTGSKMAKDVCGIGLSTLRYMFPGPLPQLCRRLLWC